MARTELGEEGAVGAREGGFRGVYGRGLGVECVFLRFDLATLVYPGHAAHVRVKPAERSEER